MDKPVIGILSIGDMGMGIAKLLVASDFRVATNCDGRRSVQEIFSHFFPVIN